MLNKKLLRYTTPLVGKKTDLEAISTRLYDPYCRLLTLLGPGGIGKTRLAVELVLRLDQDFPDGVYFVELQSLSSIHNIPQSIASALAYDFPSGKDPEAELLAYLQEKRLLFVLDNFEHLLPAHDFVATILDQTSHLKLLVTSRERLKLREEWVYEVHSLSIPPETNAASLETYESVQLFVEHVQRVRHDFSLNAENASVERICRLTDGIPLAIELAAAWVRTLPCSEIVDELQSRFDILQTNLHDVPERHRSIRAVFDHSWHLLSEDERRVMMGASVFRGGFTREAAETVLDTSLQTLSLLVDKSLLRVDGDGRYTIHELLRRYALMRLSNVPDMSWQVSERHCKYYLSLLQRPELDFDAEQYTPLIHLIDADIDNIRAGWRWAVENQIIRQLVKAMKGLFVYARLRNWRLDASQAFQSVIDSLQGTPQTEENELARALATSLHGLFELWLGHMQPDRLAKLEESVRILRRLDARPELTLAVGILGFELLSSGEFNDAEPLLKEALSLADETHNPQFQSFIMWLYANIAAQRGEAALAEERYQQALAFGKAIHDQRAVVYCLSSLGDLTFSQGLYAKARLYYEQSLEIAKNIDARTIVIDVRTNMAKTSLAMGVDLDQVQSYLSETLILAKKYSPPTAIAKVHLVLGEVLLTQDLIEEARQHFQQGNSIALTVDHPDLAAAVQAGMAKIALAHKDYPDAKARFSVSKLCYHNRGDLAAEARILVELSLVALAENDLLEARTYLLSALQHITILNRPPDMLFAIVGCAHYFMLQGNLTHAVELAALVWRQPMSSADARQHAAQVLTRAEVQLFSIDMERAAMQHQPDDLNQVCAQLVVKLQAQMEQPLFEPLSERELEVLQLVASGRSNREIAQDLTLALGTVKSHLHNILQKLDADNRTEAVTRARDLRLLQ